MTCHGCGCDLVAHPAEPATAVRRCRACWLRWLDAGAPADARNPDRERHVFSGVLPPDADTPPVCGAVLTSAYDGRNRPDCIECAAILRSARRGR